MVRPAHACPHHPHSLIRLSSRKQSSANLSNIPSPYHFAPSPLPRPVLAHDPLRVSLSDLLSASTKGKWWLVGAAWSGNPLVDAQTDPTNSSVAEQKKLREVEANGEDELMKLARKQGMNTDVRRRVFVVVMSSTVSLAHIDHRGRVERDGGWERKPAADSPVVVCFLVVGLRRRS
jgi:hypothetical protein